MPDNILVAYATKCGSTAEIAHAIGRVLRESGAAVEVAPVQKVNDLTPYSAVVLGACIRMGKPIREATRFAQKHLQALNARPVALFSVGLSMRDNTPEMNQKAVEYISPLVEMVEPVALGLFAGKVDHAKLGLFFRFAARRDNTGTLAEGDWRDWDAVDEWVRQLAPLLLGTA